MSDFASNPWISNPFDTEVWRSNPWKVGGTFYFTNTEASLTPYINVTGTPDILWTWSDGTTDTKANPDNVTTIGDNSLYISDLDAVTELFFQSQNITGEIKTLSWKKALDIRFGWNDLSGAITTFPWEYIEYLHFGGNPFSGNFHFQPWEKLKVLYLYYSNIESITGSLQTQVNMTTCNLLNNNISSQTQIDQMLSDLLVNAADAGRTAVCEVNISGANMAAPSAAGLADIDDLVNIHGWTVTHE